MDHIFEHYKKTGYLHHAHIILGLYEDVLPILIFALTKNLGISTKGNPDLMALYHESFGIDESRHLKEFQSRAPFGKGANGEVMRKIFIIGTTSFTPEAQNALLKTFEEPTEDTHFFIIIPHVEMLLPTLRSRVLIVQPQGDAPDSETKILAKKFLDSSLMDRFAMAKKLGDSKDRESMRFILDHIERMLYTRMAGQKDNVTSDIFREIHQAKTYLGTRGASPKMLLEHVGMVIENS